MDTAFARTPEPPYYAAIFSSRRSAVKIGYEDTAQRMVELAEQQPGFLGMESTRDSQGFGITVSYWESAEAIIAWRRHAEHRLAQLSGRRDWYRHYELRIARVERAHSKPD